MMTFEEAIAETKVLKQLDRITGTEKAKDYFVVLATSKARYCLKVDFAKNILGHPYAFFARMRVITPEGTDIGNMQKLLDSNGFGDKKKIEKGLNKKNIKAKYLKVDNVRLSFVCESKQTLNDYGDPTDLAGYNNLMEALKADLASIGNRVFEALRLFEPEIGEDQRIVVQGCMSDYCDMYKPIKPDPKGGKGDKVIPLKK